MNKQDLWGDLPSVEAIRTPFVILKEQAELLQEKTNGLLTVDLQNSQQGLSFGFHFLIVAPTLNNYRYNLLTLSHGLGYYPVVLTDSAVSEKHQCDDEASLLDGLHAIFTSDRCNTVIQKLLTHIANEG
jgi:hypothetical protein